MNSDGGRAYEPRALTLEQFDRLPPVVRAAIANARFDWATGAWLRKLEAGADEAELVAAIALEDAMHAAKTRKRLHQRRKWRR